MVPMTWYMRIGTGSLGALCAPGAPAATGPSSALAFTFPPAGFPGLLPPPDPEDDAAPPEVPPPPLVASSTTATTTATAASSDSPAIRRRRRATRARSARRATRSAWFMPHAIPVECGVDEGVGARVALARDGGDRPPLEAAQRGECLGVQWLERR